MHRETWAASLGSTHSMPGAPTHSHAAAPEPSPGGRAACLPGQSFRCEPRSRCEAGPAGCRRLCASAAGPGLAPPSPLHAGRASPDGHERAGGSAADVVVATEELLLQEGPHAAVQRLGGVLQQAGRQRVQEELLDLLLLPLQLPHQ